LARTRYKGAPRLQYVHEQNQSDENNLDEYPFVSGFGGAVWSKRGSCPVIEILEGKGISCFL